MWSRIQLAPHARRRGVPKTVWSVRTDAGTLCEWRSGEEQPYRNNYCIYWGYAFSGENHGLHNHNALLLGEIIQSTRNLAWSGGEIILRRVGEYAAPRVVRFKSVGGFPLRGSRRSQWDGNVPATFQPILHICFNLGLRSCRGGSNESMVLCYYNKLGLDKVKDIGS